MKKLLITLVLAIGILTNIATSGIGGGDTEYVYLDTNVNEHAPFIIDAQLIRNIPGEGYSVVSYIREGWLINLQAKVRDTDRDFAHMELTDYYNDVFIDGPFIIEVTGTQPADEFLFYFINDILWKTSTTGDWMLELVAVDKAGNRSKPFNIYYEVGY